jgi:sulfate adenylyltransferase subunit 2
MKLSHIEKLESESIHIIREVVAEFENPVMLYSIGKDSSVMLHLAQKAFAPNKIPFKLMHIDTTWKFKEMIFFREETAKNYNLDLLVHINEEGVRDKISPITHGSKIHTDIMKTQALKQALDKYRFDAAFGGARRDEEKSRSKERIFSFRDKSHRWDPKNQKPELWNLFNTKINKDESVRVFPLSNWTEIDVWQYIYQEKIPIVPLYFAKIRPIIKRNNMLIMVDDDRLELKQNEKIEQIQVRFRTLGCYPLTAAVESSASSVEEILIELLETKHSERQGRLIDNDQIGSMERKKQEGYF